MVDNWRNIHTYCNISKHSYPCNTCGSNVAGGVANGQFIDPLRNQIRTGPLEGSHLILRGRGWGKSRDALTYPSLPPFFPASKGERG